MHNFIRLLGPQRGQYVLVTLCMAVVTGSEVVIHPLLLKAIFDGISRRDSFSHFLLICAGYLTLGLTINPLSYLMSLWQARVDNRVVSHVSNQLLTACYKQRYQDFLINGSGYYLARIRSDVKDGLVPMLTTVREIFVNIIAFALLISVLIYISWQAFAVLCVIIPVSTSVSIWVSKRIRVLTSVERDTEASVMDVLTKAISAFKIVRMFSMAPKTVRVFDSSLNHALDSNYAKFRVVRLLQSAGDLTMVISDVCSMAVGAYLVFLNRLTLGSFIAFMNAFWRSASTLIHIFNKIAEMHGYSATVDRLAMFNDVTDQQRYFTVGNHVQADQISFAYGDKIILSDFSLTMSQGERTLIIGQNGSGKTTLANVLCGYLSPSSGELILPGRISGVTLPLHFPPMLLRELPIDPALLAVFGIAEPGLLDMRPDALSAGQQQKVALALALSLDADLYVLDEPLANLDPASRTVAMREIHRRSHSCMLLMIMHNADEYVSSFDHVVVLGGSTENGLEAASTPVDVVPPEVRLAQAVGAS